MMLASSASVSRAMAGANRPQRFKLSLPFLHRDKNRKNLLEDVHPSSGPECIDHDHHLPETAFGDTLQDIAEENEEQLQAENVNDRVHEESDSADENAVGIDEDHAEEEDNDEENLTLALVPKTLSPLQMQKDLALVKAPTSYKSYNISFSPVTPPSRRKNDRSSSTKAMDSSTTRSGSLRTESLSSQMVSTAAGGGKGWLRTRCGFGSCSKQIDLERDLRVKERAGHGHGGERSGSGHGRSRRHQHARVKSSDAASSWERENEWSVLAEVENEVVRKQVVLRKKKGQKKSTSKLAPSPGFSPTEAVHAATPEIKCSLRDPYEEVREAAKYDMPAQRSDLQHKADVDYSGGSHMLDTATDEGNNSGEERVHPWERSFSSPSSDDDELFTTSFEIDGQKKSHRKNWSSNSSDETEGRQRRSTAAGSHIRCKSSWSNHSARSVVHEDEVVENHKKGKKGGSRIIFLSTPPRPKELPMDEDDPASTAEHLVVKSSSDRFGEYSKLEPPSKEPRFERAFSTGFKSSNHHHAPQSSLESATDLEANAKAWSKLSLRGDDSFGENIRELPMVSRSKAPKYSRHIDVQVEDQLVNLRLESDQSDSSQGKAYSSRGSRRYSKSSSKSLEQDHIKPAKKKRGTHSRRRRGRRNRAPPPLPSDLHGKVKESVAVVKSSYDPYTDFRDSMVEMIVEKEIQGATDLEELLRCYLSLNSAEYHSVIVKVFADVWRELFADSI